jgi:hypothetical protein
MSRLCTGPGWVPRATLEVSEEFIFSCPSPGSISLSSRPSTAKITRNCLRIEMVKTVVNRSKISAMAVGCKSEVSGLFSRGTCLPSGRFQKKNDAEHLDTGNCR